MARWSQILGFAAALVVGMLLGWGVTRFDESQHTVSWRTETVRESTTIERQPIVKNKTMPIKEVTTKAKLCECEDKTLPDTGPKLRRHKAH